MARKPEPVEVGPDRELPEGWAYCSIGDLVRISSGKYIPKSHYSKDPGKPFPVAGAGGPIGFTDRSNTSGPILALGRVGAAGAVTTYPGDAWVTDNVLVLTPHIESTRRLLAEFLKTVRWSEIQTGSSQPLITQTLVKALVYPLAPLAEQKRIVAKVEKLLERVAAARERLAKVPAILKRLRQSILAAACSGRLTEEWRAANASTESAAQALARLKAVSTSVKTRRGVPDAVFISEAADQFDVPDCWAKESVAELLKCGGLLDVKDGNHGANHPKRDDFTTEGLPFITAAQVSNYSIDYDGAPKVAGKALERLRVGFAQVNDAVLTHKGTVGRAALNLRPCVLTPQTTYYRCNAEVLRPDYLVYFMTSSQLYQQMAAVMSQTTRDFVPISEQYNLFIFLPPLSEQAEIVRRVESLFRLADEIERRVAVATARADRLAQAILAKAFRGELVPTEAELAAKEGREYESAGELLERICLKTADTQDRRTAAGRVASGRPN